MPLPWTTNQFANTPPQTAWIATNILALLTVIGGTSLLQQMRISVMKDGSCCGDGTAIAALSHTFAMAIGVGGRIAYKPAPDWRAP